MHKFRTLVFLLITIALGIFSCSGISPVTGAIAGPIVFAIFLTLFLFSLAGGVADSEEEPHRDGSPRAH